MITAIIVEDNDSFLGQIRELVSKIPAIEIVGEAKSVAESVKLIESVKPDLLYLDIELEDGTSFEILEHFPMRNFQVIFTTGHNHYAIKAIKHSAIDYLLKPVDEEEFLAASKKAIELQGNKLNAQKLELMLENLRKSDFSKVAIPSVDGFEFIAKSDIICCQADGSYTTIHMLNNRSIVTTNNIKKLEDVLHEKNFYRVHKSFIVNIECIKKVFKSDGGSLLLSNDLQIPIARRRKDELMKLVGL